MAAVNNMKAADNSPPDEAGFVALHNRRAGPRAAPAQLHSVTSQPPQCPHIGAGAPRLLAAARSTLPAWGMLGGGQLCLAPSARALIGRIACGAARAPRPSPRAPARARGTLGAAPEERGRAEAGAGRAQRAARRHRGRAGLPGQVQEGRAVHLRARANRAGALPAHAAQARHPEPGAAPPLRRPRHVLAIHSLKQGQANKATPMVPGAGDMQPRPCAPPRPRPSACAAARRCSLAPAGPPGAVQGMRVRAHSAGLACGGSVH